MNAVCDILKIDLKRFVDQQVNASWWKEFNLVKKVIKGNKKTFALCLMRLKSKRYEKKASR